MKKTINRLFCVVLAMIAVFSFPAYAEAENIVDENALAEQMMAQPGAIYSDVIAGIDLDGIVTEGESTFFTSVMSDGTTVRFEGTNIAINADGLTLKPDSRVVSLDSVGSIYVYCAVVKDGESAPVNEQWLDIGYGYTNSADNISAQRAGDVYADALMGYPVAVWNNNASLSVANLEPNFVFFRCSSGNTVDITLTSLTIGYNPSGKFTEIEFARNAMPDYFGDFEAFFENANNAADVVYEEAPAADAVAEAIYADPDAIYSDIVAGIDLDGIVTEGESTFFTSVMSDGTAVRFEGKNIAVGEEGVTLSPNSVIVSLDSVGSIYGYYMIVLDGENSSAGEQWLDIGYGYTNSPDRINLERADEIYADALMGCMASEWNLGLCVSLADIVPNFVFVMSADRNTADITLTGLTIVYNPDVKFTPIETARAALPDYFNGFEAFLGSAEAADSETPVETDPVEMKMAETGAIYSDVIAGIDSGSVRVEGDVTFFSSVMSDGAVVRFEGSNISISEDGLTLNPESRVTSLDAVGKIYLYRAEVKDAETEPVCSQWLSIGGGYTFDPEKTSVERAGDLTANGTSALTASVWNSGVTISMIDFLPNFIFFDGSPSNETAITLTSLTIGYDPAEKYTAAEEILAPNPENYFTLPETAYADESSAEPAGDADSTTDNEVTGDVGDVQAYPEAEYSEELTDDDYAALKMAEPGAVKSDIIAGIDLGSIRIDGEVTFFSSVMSDGAVVRFEGLNISISEDGLTMNPGGSLVSLDAVGKIYEYSADVRDKDEAPVSEQWLNVGYGYTFSAAKTSVERADDVYTYSISGLPAGLWSADSSLSVAFYEPNFVYIKSESYNSTPFTLTSLTIGYNPAEKVTALTDARLEASQYGYYMDGEPYNAAKESRANAENREYDFYLILRQETLDEIAIENTENLLYFLPSTFYETGDLKDADGNVLDKEAARVHTGYTLDVTIGDYSFALELPMAELYEGAQTLRDARPYSTLTAMGQQHVLVVPVVWADQTDLVSDELYALYQKALGQLIDAQGQPAGDFSDGGDGVFSLTEYFDTASYGQLEISSFMTGWYYTDKTFAGDYEYVFPEIDFAGEVLEWVKATYPDIDWSQFDQDGDGCVDAIILLSVGLTQDEGYMPASFGGAVHSTGSNYGKLAGTQADPQANCFMTVNYAFMKNGETNTLIHEFSHSFGLNDYYDGSGYGVNAVGGYDMQGDSVGDWNAYSKLAVGWMSPQIVSDLASGESVELTIGSSALTGDVIILPAADVQYGGPFGEYVMIDLLTPDGANACDAAGYGLEETVGVRISHVNANMKRTAESDGVIGNIDDNGAVIGMELYDNNYTEGGFGFYNVEVIQSGGENTFTNLDRLYPVLRAEDLFYEGDTFTAEEYGQFFYQGLMDNGLPLGYVVNVLSIGTDAEGMPVAVIQITAR